jgi:hypothetical protein
VILQVSLDFGNKIGTYFCRPHRSYGCAIVIGSVKYGPPSMSAGKGGRCVFFEPERRRHIKIGKVCVSVICQILFISFKCHTFYAIFLRVEASIPNGRRLSIK